MSVFQRGGYSLDGDFLEILSSCVLEIRRMNDLRERELEFKVKAHAETTEVLSKRTLPAEKRWVRAECTSPTSSGLTKGKIYEIRRENDTWVRVREDDEGHPDEYLSYRFRVLEGEE